MSKKRLMVAGFATAMLLPCATLAQQQEAAQGDPDAARAKVSMCIGCHEIPRYKSSFPSVYHVPRIIGQSAAYIESALKAYRNGDRNHPTMTAVAAGLSDSDIADLAAYYGSK